CAHGVLHDQLLGTAQGPADVAARVRARVHRGRSRRAGGEDDAAGVRRAAALAQNVIDDAVRAEGRAPPAITLLPYEMSGRGVDALHRIGDAYVSTTHGEGVGLGAFDAATLGRPVLMTGWGGHRDYLGDDAGWPGALPYRLTSVPPFPPDAPSYWRTQRWASVGVDAVASALRAFVADPEPHRRAAARIAERIANDFAEPVV